MFCQTLESELQIVERLNRFSMEKAKGRSFITSITKQITLQLFVYHFK